MKILVVRARVRETIRQFLSKVNLNIFHLASPAARRMDRTMDEKEELVKKSLFTFVRNQVPDAQLR